MSGIENKAVFLSYASQDAEAARRICDALRAAGVEVWFDQNELVGGDAWDAKIRGQIAECALFVPVISAATQARREGYFRIEWKLAAQRTHAMADGTPFLLPVVIDATRDTEALVPAEFRAVQWTRLAGGEGVEKFCARVGKLLGGDPAGPLGERAPGSDVGASLDGARGRGRAAPLRKSSRAWLVPAILGGAVVAALAIWQPWRDKEKPVSNAASPSASRSSQLAQRARIESPDQLVVAIDLARRGTVRSPDSAQAWAALARLEAQFILRGWDISEQRRQDTQAFANKALAMDRNNTDAVFALAVVLHHQGAHGQVEALMRRAIEREPNDTELRGALGGALSGQGRHAEALAVRQETLRLFPRDALAHYDLALSYEKAVPPDFDAALRKFDDSLTLGRLTSTVLHKVALLAGWRGDLPAARQLLDTLDPLERNGDRAVGVAMLIGLLEQKPERTIEAGGLTARNYFDDDYVRGPKAWLLAHAYTMAGKPTLAQAQWQEAENVLRQRARTAPGSWFDDAGLAVTLAWLGATDEAARIMAPLESLARESPEPLRSLYLAYYQAGCGDAAKTATWLELVVNRRELVTVKTLPLDPWWAKVRGKSEFDALRTSADSPDLKSQRQTSAPAASSPDAKSIAVLAFKNLSDDQNNEYFSDGISEELINVLGSVPGLRVAGSTSAFSFKRQSLPLPEIARQLGVAYVVEGTVRKSGTALRINAKLIDAASGFPVWVSGNLDREHKDILALQTEIAGLIASHLSLKLGDTPRATKTVNPEAHRLVLEGRHFWNQRSAAALDRAEAAFRQAIALEPRFAEAHAGLADVYLVRMTNFMNSGDDAPALVELQKARQAAERARELDPSLAEPYATLGYVTLYSGSFNDAAALLQRSLALNPNLAFAHRYYVPVLAAQGRLDLAVEAARRAMEIDPLSVVNCAAYARFLGHARRYAESLEASARAIRLQVDDLAITHWPRPVALWALGSRAEATDEARLVLRAEAPALGGPEALWVLHSAGLVDEAAGFRESFEAKLVAESYVRGFNLVAVGRTDEAWPFLQRTPRGNSVNFLYYSPLFDAVRDDSRFQQLLAKLGCAEEYKVARATLARMLKQAKSAP